MGSFRHLFFSAPGAFPFATDELGGVPGVRVRMGYVRVVAGEVKGVAKAET